VKIFRLLIYAVICYNVSKLLGKAEAVNQSGIALLGKKQKGNKSDVKGDLFCYE